MRTKMHTHRILLPKHSKAKLMDPEKIIGLCLASIVCAAACTAVIMHAVQNKAQIPQGPALMVPRKFKLADPLCVSTRNIIIQTKLPKE